MPDAISAALQDSSGYVNPLMVTVKEPVVAAFHEFDNKSLGECQAADKELATELRKIATEATADGRFDANLITRWGGTAQERGERMLEMHSRLCGIRAAMRPKLELERKQKALEDQHFNGPYSPEHMDGGGMQNGVYRPNARQIRLFDGVKGHLTENGMSFDEGLRDKFNAGGHTSWDWKAPQEIEGEEFMARVFGHTQQLQHYEPYPVRLPGEVPSRERPLQVTDLIPVVMTNKDSVKWLEETEHTNSAKEKAEEALADRSSYAVTEREALIRRISHYVAVTEEAWDDEPQMRNFINRRVPYGVKSRLDRQILSGTGTAPNLRGLIGYYGRNATNDDADNAVQKLKLTTTGSALTDLRELKNPWNVLIDAAFMVADWGSGWVGQQMANTAILTPNLYKEMLKSESDAGGYYTGGPVGPMFLMPWGLRVVLNNELVDGVSTDGIANHKFSGIVGDFSDMFICLFMRHDVRVEMGYISDDFQAYRFSIRGSVRCALAVMRPEAFVGIVNFKANGEAPTD